MRVFASKNGVSVQAIAGTEVVLLGLNATQAAAKGLLGFSIYRQKGNFKEYPLGGGKIFEGIHSESSSRRVKSDKAPIQAFMWSDYAADANTQYTYRIVPVYGKPDALEPGTPVKVTLRTEDPDDGTHGVFFNRGVAGSQAYSRRFGKYRRAYKVKIKTRDGEKEIWKEFLKPEDVPDREAYKWLSRGLEEAMLAFINQAKGEEYGLRASLYELTHMPAVQAFVDAFESGADVRVVHDTITELAHGVRSNSGAVTTVDFEDPGTDALTLKKKEAYKYRKKKTAGFQADRSLRRIGLLHDTDREAWKRKLERFDDVFIDRTNVSISHNKFIILLKNGKPVQVWTGSTNLTGGGIYGQSNVGHIVRDELVAQKYLDFWNKLASNPKKSSPKPPVADQSRLGMKYWTVTQQPDLSGAPPPESITPIFSPRKTSKMLDWYGKQMGSALHSVHFTTAFTVSKPVLKVALKKVAASVKSPYLRYLLLEGKTGLMKEPYKKMAPIEQNCIAWGETLRKRRGDEQEIETLTGLNDHVNYLHTKYMLIDALTNDPVVISGSANFSDASTVNNDENMLVIRGNTRVADIFLGEFMRLFNHFRNRNVANARTDAEAETSRFLDPSSSWTKPYYQKGSRQFEERLLFSKIQSK